MKELRWLREEPKSHAFFLYLFFIFYFMCFVLINYWEQRLRAALAMVKKKPHPHLSTRRQGKGNQPKSLGYETNGMPATQNKKSNSA